MIFFEWVLFESFYYSHLNIEYIPPSMAGFNCWWGGGGLTNSCNDSPTLEIDELNLALN